MIKIHSLHKYYNKGKQNEIHVINDVTLELPERGMVAIFGESGCGKTTLLNVIGGLDGYASGSLTIEGNDVREKTDETRNRYVGYIFQNYNLQKEETCYENVANALRLIGITDETLIEERVMSALENVGMEKYEARTPDTLSGGQQQRIAIARAIVKNPPIILADEPTGNLDEANTVMIMDLLKQISRDHLVLLVTHEAELVDYYCDKAIELSDGKIVRTYDNQDANGYSARDKNDVYLGELSKTELKDENAELEYYGDHSDEPIKIRIVRVNGKTYLSVDTPKVQVLDAGSEIKLREGVYEGKAAKNTVSESVDMSKLPPIDGKKYGKLFSLRSAIKSGYAANFKKGKRGKKFLRRCLGVFAAVLVFATALFGTAFAKLDNFKKSYNPNVFYVYTEKYGDSEKLETAIKNQAETGIDYIRLYGKNVPPETVNLELVSGFFETFNNNALPVKLATNAVLFDESACQNLPLVLGKKTGLEPYELVITTTVADALLKNSAVGYISKYKDLLGLVSNELILNGNKMRIAGIVRADEPSVYAPDYAVARYTMQNVETPLEADERNLFSLKDGETVLVVKTRYDYATYPTLGEKIKLHGKEFTVTYIVEKATNYIDWLHAHNFSFGSDVHAYVEYRAYEDVKAAYPDWTEGSIPFLEKRKAFINERLFEYTGEYYAHFEQFVRDFHTVNHNLMSWLVVEKGIRHAYHGINNGSHYGGGYSYIGYLDALNFKADYGRFPTQAELSEEIFDPYDTYTEAVDFINGAYNSDYNAEYKRIYGQEEILDTCFYVTENDYIALSKRLGETHGAASPDLRWHGLGNVNEPELDEHLDGYYTLVHSVNPEKTKAFLEKEFTHEFDEKDARFAIYSPEYFYKASFAENRIEVITDLVSLVVLLVLMCLCMYFIMRSSLLGRVKEVGIYRAIGVSKRNMLFKFLIETLVLTTLTVFLGYLLSSVFMFVCAGGSAFMETVFYYPPWLAVTLLALLYGVSVLCGILPVLALLRKNPSEILSKYDI